MYQINGGTAALMQPLSQKPVETVVASSRSVYGEGLYRDADRVNRAAPARTVEPMKEGNWELDGLISAGIEYVYFIDEIFLPYRDLLEMVAISRHQVRHLNRIDLWKSEMIDLLGEAGCVSVEAGVESITEQGRDQLA